jgi:hypothetical protein
VPIRQREERKSAAGECRECRAFCDKLVDPAGCLAIGCDYLYSYEDVASGQRYMGCMNKVFKGEIDMDAFVLAEMSGGFGGLKMTGDPLPQCQFAVERSYEGEGPAFECVNRKFFDCATYGNEGIEVFDLRNRL